MTTLTIVSRVIAALAALYIMFFGNPLLFIFGVVIAAIITIIMGKWIDLRAE